MMMMVVVVAVVVMTATMTHGSLHNRDINLNFIPGDRTRESGRSAANAADGTVLLIPAPASRGSAPPMLVSKCQTSLGGLCGRCGAQNPTNMTVPQKLPCCVHFELILANSLAIALIPCACPHRSQMETRGELRNWEAVSAAVDRHLLRTVPSQMCRLHSH